jgi:hypothetical protein
MVSAPRELGLDFDGHATVILAKAGKEGRRRESIDHRARSRVVLAKIAEHIRERVPSGSRRCQRAPVPSVGPEAPSSKDEAVHPPRDPNGETSHSSRKSVPVGGLDQQVQVISLHREMHDAKHAVMALIRLGDGALQRRKNEPRSQRPKRRTQGHMHRVPR